MRLVRCGLVALLMVGGACGGSSKPQDGGVDPNHVVGTWDPDKIPGLDILFMVDDSSSMRLAQDNLLRNFPTFMTRLQEPPGLPDIHVAVISSDMGAGDGSITGCSSTGGKQGIFQYTARGACLSSGLNPGATFIADNGLGVSNYTGNLADVFACIAALGEAGCGYEHQFAAILRALGADGRAPPADNQGFLRPDAVLAIIMVTNEDDCSAVPGSRIFDTTSTLLASEFGPTVSFRCSEFGHLCDGGPPGRVAPNNDPTAQVTYNNCVSNEAGGYLLSAVDTANKIKALKADPSKQIAVASIQAPTTPYTVTWKSPSENDTSCGAASCPHPWLAHSCMATDGSFGDPGVRTAAFVDQFGANGLELPICSTDFGPALDRTAMLLRDQLAPPCIQGNLADAPNNPGQRDCKVTGHYRNASGSVTVKPVPSCVDSLDEAPCWQLVAGDGTCLGQRLDIKFDPAVPIADQGFSYDCRLCAGTPTSPECG